jgi:hypothetical protein
MTESLEETLERFTGRRTAQGDSLRQRFAVFPSRQEPRCLVPVGDAGATLAGFHGYRPYEFRDRVVKGVLAQLVRTGWSGWAMHSLYLGEPLGLKALVANITGERNPVFAMLLSTPGKYRKLTIQVMRPGGKTIGYVKLALSKPALARVRHEAAVLHDLAALRPRVPRVLYAGEWQDSYLVFLSALEGRPGPAELSGMHVEFLEKLAAIGRATKPGRILVEEIGARWEEVAWRCDWRWQRIGAAALAEARRELDGVTVPCALSHGDFSPWNTRVHDGELGVCDWENCAAQAPIGWDTFHFSVEAARARRKSWKAEFDFNGVPGARGLFLLYLVDSLGQALEEQTDSPDALECRRQLLTNELGMHEQTLVCPN